MSAHRHLLVAGAQRCGTTYLHHLLESHPQVAMARPARPEPKVFNDATRAAQGHAWYDAEYFAHAGDEAVWGEKSTTYLESAETAERAAQVLGDPLVLVQVRDPLARAVSHWAFSTDSGLETRPLAQALAENLEGPLPWDPTRTSVSPYAYLERGHYETYLAPWAARFGDDLHVVVLEELLAEPARVGDVYAALGVDAAVRPDDLGEPVNASSAPAPDLEPDLVARLRDHFAASDAALAARLGRPLPWRPTSEGAPR